MYRKDKLDWKWAMMVYVYNSIAIIWGLQTCLAASHFPNQFAIIVIHGS